MILLGCKKTAEVKMDLTCPISARKGYDAKLVGKWKLVKSESVFMNRNAEDYSCNKIIYDFRSDGTLVITSDIDKYIGSKPGTYQYKFTKTSLYEGGSQSYMLQVNQRSVACGISEGVMNLDDSPVDGPILYLVRL